MSKVFTITKGLENLGALKTGGQASVYKGKRTGEIISAIKIIPTPVFSESTEDKNYSSFQNEVQKLKRVNEDASPNVVSILSYGITESGNFPYIEMEFVEGPDLSEILKQEGRNVFEIKDLLLVAKHVSNALSHCHNADVKHGDIKSNNIRLNKHTGNYVLLDFGLSVMSDELRRTSFRNAGAIEFMAPEQNNGDFLFETDIYSFGIIMFELIAGQVPFPLNDNAETARNAIMVAHLETLPPDALSLRKQALSTDWPQQKKDGEMLVPAWLLNMTYKCLEKNPADRFSNGIVLHEYVMKHIYIAIYNDGITQNDLDVLKEENQRLVREKLLLQQKLQQSHTPVSFSDYKNAERTGAGEKEKRRLSKKTNVAAIFIFFIAAALVYFFIINKNKNSSLPATQVATTATDASTLSSLQAAREHLDNNRLAAALLIFKNLSDREVPEAMFQYGSLTLEGRNPAISCDEAIKLIDKAASTGYAHAKKTLGFLYAFADDEEAIKQHGFVTCIYQRNIRQGSRLLMEANLLGDDEAGKLLIELNAQIQSGRRK
ncbi:MAG: protein kinase [Ferruginibacter sp.]